MRTPAKIANYFCRCWWKIYQGKSDLCISCRIWRSSGSVAGLSETILMAHIELVFPHLTVRYFAIRISPTEYCTVSKTKQTSAQDAAIVNDFMKHNQSIAQKGVQLCEFLRTDFLRFVSMCTIVHTWYIWTPFASGPQEMRTRHPSEPSQIQVNNTWKTGKKKINIRPLSTALRFPLSLPLRQLASVDSNIFQGRHVGFLLNHFLVTSTVAHSSQNRDKESDRW